MLAIKFLLFDAIIFYSKEKYKKKFRKTPEGLSIPNLIEVQKNSYDEFLKSKTLDQQLDELSKGMIRFLIAFSQLKMVTINLL